jgi:HlyD family secretion protein
MRTPGNGRNDTPSTPGTPPLVPMPRPMGEPLVRTEEDFSEDLRLESRPVAWVPLAIGGSLSLLVLSLVAAAAVLKVDRVVPVQGKLQTLRSTQEVATPEQGIVSQVLVKENQEVQVGQPLVILDTEALRAEAASMVDKESSLRATASAEVQRLRAAIGEARARLVGAQEQLKITDTQLSRLRPLAQEGGYGQLNILDAEKTRSELVSRIASTEAEILKLQAESAQKEADLVSARSTNRASLVATRRRLREIVLRAPLAGTILDLKAKPGQVVQNAESVLKLVPKDNLQAQVNVPDADLAFVRPGQSAEVEFPAYRRDTYGWLPAVVTGIGTDALPPDETNKFSRFPVKLKLSKQYLESKGKRYSLQAGMALTANLRLEKASLLELFASRFSGGARAIRTIR